MNTAILGSPCTPGSVAPFGGSVTRGYSISHPLSGVSQPHPAGIVAVNTITYSSSDAGLLVVLCIPIILLYIALWRFYKKRMLQFVKRENVPAVIRERSHKFFWLYALSLAISFALASMALMQPEMEEEVAEKQTRFGRVDEIVFLLDDSASMGATDTQSGAARFSRAQEIIDSLLQRLGGVSVSIYAFGGDVENVVPATLGYLSARLLLHSWGLDETETPGTNFSELFSAMQKKYVGVTSGKKVKFVLLTDGEDTTILGVSSQEKKVKEAELIGQIEPFSKEEMPWYVVGIGSSKGVPIPNFSVAGQAVTTEMHPEFLQAISAISKGGKCYFDSDLNLSELTDDLAVELLYQKSAMESATEKKGNLFYYPLIGSCLFLLTALLLRDRVRYA